MRASFQSKQSVCLFQSDFRLFLVFFVRQAFLTLQFFAFLSLIVVACSPSLIVFLCTTFPNSERPSPSFSSPSHAF